ncbi:ras-associated and pleckstrin homology domains-containing protein 1-like [Schistocerca nitens]|uniref:ras-associated and pleckstrin homology domains-containing protein 1-like n=1 Tax=Schistocerca nitens TaxID=7011 RepID=UPI0021191E62|nr:ras-associated and pleckstrin homology domains-containing protein 1-like [Schistocerca nitens]
MCPGSESLWFYSLSGHTVTANTGSGSSWAAVAAAGVVGAASLKRAGVPQPAVRSAPQPPPPSPKLAAHRTMAAKVLLLGSVVALAAASLRPTNPDQLHELLLWAQRVQSAGAHSGARLHDKPSSQEKPSHSQQNERPAVPISPPPPPPPPPPRPQPQVWSPPPVADSVLELLRPGLPAYEEYDRNQRFSHSFLHGYRHT